MTLCDVMKEFQNDETMPEVEALEGLNFTKDVCLRLIAMKDRSSRAHSKLEEHRIEMHNEWAQAFILMRDSNGLRDYLASAPSYPQEQAHFRFLGMASAIRQEAGTREIFLTNGGEMLAAAANSALKTFNTADKSGVVAFPKLDDPQFHPKLGRVAAWVSGIAAPAMPALWKTMNKARLAAAADALPLVEAMARFTEVAFQEHEAKPIGQTSPPVAVMALLDIAGMMGYLSSLRGGGEFHPSTTLLDYIPGDTDMEAVSLSLQTKAKGTLRLSAKDVAFGV